MDGMDGLVNRLEGVHVGDFIILQSPKLDAGGYVADFSPRQVTLSHEDPFSEKSHKITAEHRMEFSTGDRTYNLRCFDSYEILKQKKSE